MRILTTSRLHDFTGSARLPRSHFLHLHGFLADALAEIVELGAAVTAALGDFDAGDPRGMVGKDALDALAIAEFADGKRFADSCALDANDNAGENLNALLAAFG